MRSLLRTFATGLVAFSAVAALAQDQAKIGETAPDIEATSFDNYEGKPSLDKFKDQIVVLFFFRTSDSTSMDEAVPILNKVHDAFNKSGVVIIGLTDEKKTKAESIIKGKEIKFIIGYESKSGEKYNVPAPPRIYLIDTSRKLVNHFHPLEDLEQKIRDQIRKTPPAGSDPATLKKRLRQAQTAFRNEEYGKAYTLAQDVKKLADEESDIGKSVKELIDNIEEGAKNWLEEAKQAAKAEDYAKACRILAELSVRFAGHDIGGEADTEIGRLMGNRDLKPRIRTAVDNAKGQLLNDQAADHEASKRYLEAINLYREVTEEYADTDAGKAAEEAIERIKEDAIAQQTIKKLRAEEEADRWLDIADRYAKVEMVDKAREYYQRVIEAHPATDAAKTARTRVETLPEYVPEEDEDRDEEEVADEDDKASGT